MKAVFKKKKTQKCAILKICPKNNCISEIQMNKQTFTLQFEMIQKLKEIEIIEFILKVK